MELFTKVRAAEFGDRDSLGELMDRAGDGPPYLRRQLSRVPAGYRVQALPPDPDAIEALQKLEDANAIPAFEMAALRSAGNTQKRYELMTEYFYALQELIGGGNRNIPFWGQEGWEPGAFRSFGEPMGIEADQYGDLYIADIGNHRLQRFTSQGRHDRLWGSEPAIANVWFQGKRRYHVSGAAPGEKPGEFVNPVAIDMIPGKDNDGFVVLDTAPTGHTLRLMLLPRAWTRFLDTNTTGASCLGPLAGLDAKRSTYQNAMRALADRDWQVRQVAEDLRRAAGEVDLGGPGQIE